MPKDPYKYFRVEARELLEGLMQGTLQLEKGPPAPEAVARLLRLAHTLKGAARVVKEPGIAELAHTIEGLLTILREAGQPLSKAHGSDLLRPLDEIAARLSALETARDVAAAGPAHPSAEEPLETLRVEIREMDSLLRTVTEAGVQLGAVRKRLGAAGHVQHGLAADVERVGRTLEEVRDVAHRLRLIPAQTVFASLDRSVRDAAQTLGTRVAFEASGGEVRLDAHVLASLRDALMHVVRNAVAHGVETEAERVARGKPPTGQVRLDVERRGSRVAFVCSDDGRGIDVEAVRRAAVGRGLVPASEAQSLPADQVIALLRTAGLTTSQTVTELSGRGIGLDVVRATMSQLKGDMGIRSEPGRGVTVEVQVPISIASLQGLVVEAAGALAAIPLDAVRQTLRVRDSEIARSATSDSILHEGRVIPFVPLDQMLRRPGTVSSLGGRNRSVWSAVVVHAGDRRVAVGVDRLLGTANIVIRALPGVVEADRVIAGASLDAEGNPQLVLDPEGLVAAAERGRGTASQDADPRRAPVLVIDDSLTTRMLEQSILESAGYEVELALSGEEALAKVRDRRYSLFIVDVEMPGMDGFEFVAQTRADAVLRDIPAILVTSRNAVEDRRRGEQVGARAYIVKGEFDQGQLIQTIRTLIG